MKCSLLGEQGSYMKYRIIKYFLKGILFIFAEWSQHTNNKETETERLPTAQRTATEI
jgi:hypothetical protein